MKTTTALLLTAVLVAAGLAAPEASAGVSRTSTDATSTSVVPVAGDDFRRGVQVASSSCSDAEDPPTSGFDFEVVADAEAPSGSHAIAWSPTSGGFARGPVARVEDPRTLAALSLQVQGPVSSGLTPLTTGSGVVIADYRPVSADGTWKGLAGLSVDVEEGWTPVEASGIELRWTRVVAGEPVEDGGTATIQEFATAQGPGPAFLGFGFGCDEETIRIDALRVATDSEDRMYDFEEYASVTELSFAGSRRDRSTTTTRFGRAVKLDVAARTRQGQPLVGDAVIRSTTRAGSADQRTLPLDSDGAALSLMPLQNTRVRARYLARDSFAGSSSSTLTIRVKPAVRARVTDSRPTVGELVVFAGSQQPALRTAVVLQRRTESRWKTVARTRTTRAGTFRLPARVSQPGRSAWRVVSSGGPGLVDGATGAIRLKAQPRRTPPPPMSPSGPPAPSPSPSPEPEPEPEPQPEPQPEPGGGGQPPPPPPGPLQRQQRP